MKLQNRLYFLQQTWDTAAAPSRLLIDTKEWPEATTLQECLAPSWLDAKKKLGYFLSPMQKWVLENRSQS
jgi:hypothetical protein